MKLGPTISDSRTFSIGLPQGRVLSPVFFNVVMSRVVAVPTTDYTAVATSIYAEYLCIRGTSKNANQEVGVVKDAIDNLGKNLADRGLEISVEKSRFACFRASGAPRVRVILPINDYKLEGASSHKFLGLTLHARYNGIPYVDATLPSARGLSLAIKRLAWRRWGSSPGTLMHLHNSLVESRTCYTQQYSPISESQGIHTATENSICRG